MTTAARCKNQEFWRADFGLENVGVLRSRHRRLCHSWLATSFTRSFTIRPISSSGTALASGKRIVDFFTSCETSPARCCDNTITDGVERIVLLPPGKIDHRVTVDFVCRDVVRDRFFGSGNRFANSSADALKYGPRSLRLRRDIFIHGFEARLCHHMQFNHADSQRATRRFNA